MATDAAAANLFGDLPMGPEQKAFCDQLVAVEDTARQFLLQLNKLRDMSTAITLKLNPDADLKPAKKVHVQKALLTKFDLLHQLKFNAPACIDGGKDASIITRLLKQYTQENLEELMVEFFELDDDFTQRAGYTIGVFSTKIAGMIARRNGPVRTHGVSRNTSDNRRQSAIAVGIIHQTSAAQARHR
jgi:hypothetical protein